jgi:hypothetical protein
MSTILKALRRLEEDRSAQSQRPLRAEVMRDSASAKSRLGGRPLPAALLVLGLGVAVGVGALAFWYLGRGPEPAQPTELAAAGSAEPRAKPVTPAKRARAAKRARPRSVLARSPAAAPSAAAEQDLPAAALASKVEMLKRPPARPRIAAPERAEPEASARAGSGPPRGLDLAEVPGRHEPPVSRSRSGRSPSIVARPKAPVPPGGAPAPAGAEVVATSQVATAAPAQESSRRPAALPETEPRAEQPREAPKPEPAASEPPAGSGAVRARDTERRATTPRPEPTHTEAAAEESSKKAAKPAAAAWKREPGKPASSEIARAEIPGLRVERTVWHPTAERRVAVIEFDQSAEHREIREGDAVGPLVVSKIEPSGVVFVHEGVEVRRRVGE